MKLMLRLELSYGKKTKIKLYPFKCTICQWVPRNIHELKKNPHN